MKLSSDSSLIACLFLRGDSSAQDGKHTVVVAMCLILGVDRNLLFVVRKMFSLHKHVMEELEC